METALVESARLGAGIRLSGSHTGSTHLPLAVDRKWHVLHTRSRQEKSLAADLNAMGIEHFLPLVREVKYYGPRTATVEIPLFAGYVFIHGTLADAYRADRTKRVAQVIAVADQARMRWELSNLRVALEYQMPLDPFPCLKRGVRVEVRSGPFRGLQGVIEDKPRPDRLVLQVGMLGRAVSLEVDGSILDRLD